MEETMFDQLEALSRGDKFPALQGYYARGTGGVDVEQVVSVLDTAIPPLANCGTYLAQDNQGQWHYLNHARTWQACPPPHPIKDTTK